MRRPRANGARGEPWAAQAEVDMLRALQATRKSFVLHRIIARLTSPRVGEDLASGVAMISVAALWELGYRLFWTDLMAAVLCGIAFSLAHGSRPARKDVRLETAFPANGNAIVSVLVVFATVLFGELALAAQSGPLVAVCIGALALCAYSRLLAMAHFPHQIALSVLLGAAAMVLTRSVASRLPPLSANQSLAATYFAGSMALGMFFLQIEDDASSVRPFNLAKSEYKRVLYDIMDSDAALEQRPQPRGLQQPPRDSFVNLVRSMEARSMGATSATPAGLQP